MPTKAEVGERIKRFRLEKNMTLKDIEVKAHVSATHVSEIERGMTSPTVGALAKIAGALGTEPSFFLEKNTFPRAMVVRRGERRTMSFQGWGATYHSLSPGLPRSLMSFLEVELEKGAGNLDVLSRHEGEEYLLVTKGVLEISIGDERRILKEGDSIHYKSHNPHSIRNIGDSVCRAIWVTTPRFCL
jgi:transcriptional regulator with XRE-family HTH domain